MLLLSDLLIAIDLTKIKEAQKMEKNILKKMVSRKNECVCNNYINNIRPGRSVCVVNQCTTWQVRLRR
jgi:hypothetical protein